ncbi:MAG: phosphomannomutase [Rhodospirillaceae bacterium]|nr:phosphomannomutase [Rhodospirillaceae bacterium]
MANGHIFHPTLLREYDIRGVVGDTLKNLDARIIGKVFGSRIIKSGGKSVAIGRDGRHSSPLLEEHLADGLIAAGLTVYRIGLCATPQLYFAVHHLKSDGGVMVTGSHNPPEYNGFKMMLGTAPFYGQDIKDMALLASTENYTSGTGAEVQIDVLDDYLKRLIYDLEIDRELSIVWDCGNGVAGPVVKNLCQTIPGKHEILFSDVDGDFPNHHPDPTIDDNLETLLTTVGEKNADLGIAFDGDGDRIGVVDNNKNIIWGDQLLAILAEDVLRHDPGATIIADVKASQTLFDRISQLGGIPLMWKTGHSLIKNKMRETRAPLAGEMSGHIFFKDKYFGFDDAIYAALRLIELVSKRREKLSDIRSNLPYAVNTPELRFPCDETLKFSIIDKVKSIVGNWSDHKVSDIDGVRVTTENGWWLIRASNTQAVLVARCEANSEKNLKLLKDQLKNVLKKVNIRHSDF